MLNNGSIPLKLVGRWNRCKQSFQAIRVSHIWREANLVADQAAKYATTLEPMVELKMEHKPDWIEQWENPFCTYERVV